MSFPTTPLIRLLKLPNGRVEDAKTLTQLATLNISGTFTLQ